MIFLGENIEAYLKSLQIFGKRGNNYEVMSNFNIKKLFLRNHKKSRVQLKKLFLRKYSKSR